jgi:hypothetical protein
MPEAFADFSQQLLDWFRASYPDASPVTLETIESWISHTWHRRHDMIRGGDRYWRAKRAVADYTDGGWHCRVDIRGTAEDDFKPHGMRVAPHQNRPKAALAGALSHDGASDVASS